MEGVIYLIASILFLSLMVSWLLSIYIVVATTLYILEEEKEGYVMPYDMIGILVLAFFITVVIGPILLMGTLMWSDRRGIEEDEFRKRRRIADDYINPNRRR